VIVIAMWGIVALILGSFISFRAYRAHRYWLRMPTKRTNYKIYNAYTDGTKRKAAEVRDYTFPGTVVTICQRQKWLHWGSMEVLMLGPDESTLPLRIGWGITWKDALRTMDKRRMEDISRLTLTKMVLRRTWSPAVMESIRKIMEDTA
jgi:hypothetical protein